MLKILLIFCMLLCLQLNAQKQQTLFDQLVYVNEQWLQQPDVDPSLKLIPAKPMNEQQLIQFHLQQTEKLLLSRNVCELPNELQQQRKKHLNTLQQYYRAGVFPVNDKHEQRQPYFIDKFNTYCAVGYLMKESGADDIARNISQRQNYNALFDIYHPNLMSWVSTTGLKVNELALIQPFYGCQWQTSITELHYNNTGTDVNEYIEFHQYHGFSSRGYADSLLFYDENGTIYKRLPVSAMQTTIAEDHQFKYYLFQANENFADKGKIEIKGTVFITPNLLLQSITYTDVSITITTYYPPTPQPTIEQYSFGENESTPIGSSLNNCNTGGLSVGTATNGAPSSCLNLPVSLSRFDYTVNSKKVQLNWETATETNSRHFIIERSSNGNNFEAIGSVQGSGNSNSLKKYSFTDAAPLYTNHYRLKQVDADGHFTYSKILFVRFNAGNPLSIGENPVKGSLQVNITTDQSKLKSLVLYDMYGREVKRFIAKSGSQQLDVSSVAPGKYLLQVVTGDGEVFYQQVMKQ